MCGIAGIISLKDKLIDKEILLKMTDSIIHRGPDGSGHWHSENLKVGLGHRRLSILDLSENGAQPMSFKDRYVITFNGEIYNYIEIKTELTSLGIEFRTASDTEVILAAYHQWKEECLSRFDGMFAFVIYDRLEDSFFIARDRFGEKPFYYSIQDDVFYFGSEIKVLHAANIGLEIDQTKIEKFIDDNVLFNSLELSKTFFNNVISLEHSHFLQIDKARNIVKEKYWDVSYETTFNGSFDEACEKFKELLSTSVQRRLRSDVPVGTSLSGGMDSSIVVSLVSNEKNNESQFTFSAEFPGFEKDEGKYVRSVLNHFSNIKGISIYPDKLGLENDLSKIIKAQDEPFGSASIYVQWEVYKRAVKDVKVMLDGQGADEFLGGLTSLHQSYLNQLSIHDRSLYREELKEYNSIRNHLMKDLTVDQGLRMKLGGLKNKIVGKEIYSKDHFKQTLYNATMKGSLQSLLRFADRNSMAHSIEVRLPFLFHELVEFTFSLPAEYLIKMGRSKYILRKSFENQLPEDIIWRKEKIGFEPPQKEWTNSKESVNYTNDKDWRSMICKELNIK
jgi:asparagine synthase (glutamine-hydrolysing)